MASKTLKDLVGGLSLWHVWAFQAYHEVSARYRRTAMGSLWIAGQMVFTSIAYALVFSGLSGAILSDTLPWIMGGVLCFTVVSAVLTESPEVFLSNSGIISNNAFPFTYYTFEHAAKIFILFLHNLVVFEIVMGLVGALVVPHWSIIIGLLLVWFNVCAWGSMVSMIAARYRDLRFLLPYTSTLLLFLSPVIWRPEQMQTHSLLVNLNPFYPFIEMLRSPLLGVAMPAKYWLMASIVSLLGVVLWVLVFGSFRKRIPFWV
jgi:ABC-type polysaccharide/polyol phosphate export permease